MECEAVGVMVFEIGGATPVGAEGCWEVPEDCPEGAVTCPEGAEGAAGCAVEPVGAGVNPMLAAIEAEHSANRRLEKSLEVSRCIHKRARKPITYWNLDKDPQRRGNRQTKYISMYLDKD